MTLISLFFASLAATPVDAKPIEVDVSFRIVKQADSSAKREMVKARGQVRERAPQLPPLEGRVLDDGTVIVVHGDSAEDVASEPEAME